MLTYYPAPSLHDALPLWPGAGRPGAGARQAGGRPGGEEKALAFLERCRHRRGRGRDLEEPVAGCRRQDLAVRGPRTPRRRLAYEEGRRPQEAPGAGERPRGPGEAAGPEWRDGGGRARSAAGCALEGPRKRHRTRPRGRDSRRQAARGRNAFGRGSRPADRRARDPEERSEEHTSELQSLMRISYAV